MTEAMLEHVNITVDDPSKTAERLCALFGWRIRWQGDAIHSGRTVHVGADGSYIALYRRPESLAVNADSYGTRGGLNHVGVLVEDLDAVETRVREIGYEPHSHADYEPGRRFYFHDDDGIEFEVISYA
ncbi:MAG: VOC family protein [Pseudomonadota bacterium]